MKKYIVKLNRPVFIREEQNLQPVYGFLSDYNDDNGLIDSYVSYLAAMHQWSVGREKEFDVKDANWIDRKGKMHFFNDSWSDEICERCRNEIALEFSLHTIDLDITEGMLPGCGIDGSTIICESLLDNLISLAEQQTDKQTEQYNVILFNRPIWLPRNVLWVGEKGYCHIYGIVSDREMDSQLLEDCNAYLGYLVMCQEVTLKGQTPSGYTANLEQDGANWHKDGEEFTCSSDEIKEEGLLCQKKHNLKLYSVILKAPQELIQDCVRNDFLLSKKL